MHIHEYVWSFVFFKEKKGAAFLQLSSPKASKKKFPHYKTSYFFKTEFVSSPGPTACQLKIHIRTDGYSRNMTSDKNLQRFEVNILSLLLNFSC